MKKTVLSVALGLLCAMGYSQISFKIQSQTFTRPDTVVFFNTTPNTNNQKWTFPGGTVPPDSTNNPYVTVIYKTPGKYAVSLLVDTNNLGGSAAALDTTIKNMVFAPGIVTKNMVLCTTYDTITLVATGGAAYNWKTTGASDSTTTIYSAGAGYYSVTIYGDSLYTVSMTDSVKVTVATDPGIQSDYTQYCAGDSVALILSSAIKSYTINNMFMGEGYQIGDTVKGGPFSNAHPYYYKHSQVDYFAYTDTLGCSWTASTISIGSDSIARPSIGLYDQTICEGSSANYYLTSYELPVKWYRNDSLLSSQASYQPSDSGKYVVKIFDGTHLCSTNDKVHISYYSAIANTISSVNYLPGIGYISSYIKNADAQNYADGFALYNTNNVRIDSVEMVDTTSTLATSVNSYGKLPIIIDTNSYNKVPGLFMTSYNSCGAKASSSTVSPVWLTVKTDLNNNASLTWTPYTVKSVSTYYIFRGTSPDNMELLTAIASSATRAYTDIAPPAGSIYAIGVKDSANDGKNYQSMLLGWQAGYITSNISPKPTTYNRIGVFAFLQNDQPHSTIYLQAVAPKADSIVWKLADYDSAGINLVSATARGTRISHAYNHFGDFDVTVFTYTKSVVDSLYLPKYITINNPVYFDIDTIYKHSGTDTLSIDITSTIVNNMSFLSSNPAQWFVSDIQMNSRVFVQQAYNGGYANVKLLVWVNPAVGDTTLSIALMGDYLDYYFSSMLTIVVTGKAPQKPVLRDSIPEQVASNGKLFIPLNLRDWIYDDYTPFTQLVFKTDTNPYFTFTVSNGYLYANQTDQNFTGTTHTILKVINGSSLETDVPIEYTQPYLIHVPISKPTVSFYANTTLIKPNTVVRFYTKLSSADSVTWNFGDGVIVSGTQINPVVLFAKSGKYTISLTAKNIVGSTEYTKPNYIIVSSLTPTDTTICKGDTVTISVLGGGFDSYSWNTNPVQTTAAIKVAPAQTTNYKVVMKKGVSTVSDSVTISIAKQPYLGKDTSFCQGGSLLLTPGIFNSYAWNGLTAGKIATFNATTAGKVTVVTIDSNGCNASDTITIGTLYPKPVVSLGNDTTFCWNKSATLDAGNTGAQYKWSTSATTQTIKADTTRSYSVTVTAKTCSNSGSINIKVIVPVIPQIGVVTQSLSGKNLVAWETQNNKGISLYHVWELSSSNAYVIAGTIPKDSLTVFIDQNSNPIVQSYSYALSTVDSACGNESQLSAVHTSIHLSCILQPDNSVIATWNNYIGLPVSQYIIYRAEKGSTLMPYDTIAANLDSSMTTYHDTLAIGLNSYYQVAFNLAKDVVPNLLKSDTGPFSQSLSNMAESQLTGVTITPLVADVVVYPNPAKDKLSVAIYNNKNAVSVELINTLGEVVFANNTGVTGETMMNIDVTKLSSGVYIFKVNTKDGLVTKQVVISR